MDIQSHSGLIDSIFSIKSDQDFNDLALKIFRYQSTHNSVYREFIELMKIDPIKITRWQEIPLLPIQTFKTHKVVSVDGPFDLTFHSSGTTTNTTSTHLVKSKEVYERSFMECFQQFYGAPSDYCILGLLPSYLERGDSSLVYMTNQLMRESAHPNSGFYLDDFDRLINVLDQNQQSEQKTLLLGVSFALMDLAEKNDIDRKHLIIMETGGMKGRRKELVREELHSILKSGFGVDSIHSEYGMTELLSQAYSSGDGKYCSPPWMKTVIRDVHDPLDNVREGITGAIGVIDLANIYSCSFLETQDLGRINTDGTFEVLGRFDHSDVRGCNLMI